MEKTEGEIFNMIDLETFEWVDETDDITTVKSKWVFSVKEDEQNKPKHRARLTANGFTQT